MALPEGRSGVRRRPGHGAVSSERGHVAGGRLSASAQELLPTGDAGVSITYAWRSRKWSETPEIRPLSATPLKLQNAPTFRGWFESLKSAKRVGCVAFFSLPLDRG
jgi:hypothetical protein